MYLIEASKEHITTSQSPSKDPPSKRTMSSEARCHVFLVSFPGQGHINPMLRLGKKLAAKGLLVTFCTTINFGRDMKKANNITDQPTPFGDGFIRFEFFDDGFTDDGLKNIENYMPQLERFGRLSLAQMINKQADQNRPVSCVIGNPFISWVCDVAHELGIPCATFWVQSCASFAVYYHHFHQSVPYPSEIEPNIDVQLPSLPLLKHDEIPSFLHSNDRDHCLGKAILGQFHNLSIPFCILMDTYEELEPEVINHMSKICPIKPVGPLFKNPNKQKTTVSGDRMRADDCIEWLNSKPPQSVVYVSFGSVVYLKQEQVDEIAYGLCDSKFSFLWVLKPPQESLGMKPHILPDGIVEKAGDRANLVQWSPQEQVLSHPSIACFVTHCGWNSSVEALSSGVPVVAFPQWGDQVTNAKFLVDVFGIGLRLSRGAAEDRLVSREEIQTCLLDAMVGPKAEELRRNALKWQTAADQAVADGGSSDQNIKEFINVIRKSSS